MSVFKVKLNGCGQKGFRQQSLGASISSKIALPSSFAQAKIYSAFLSEHGRNAARQYSVNQPGELGALMAPPFPFPR
jgi:hypothetical protein